MTAKSLMIVGTTSSAGKSLLVTALCHSFARRGYKVAPFKAQNMSNNAAVCSDGSEIGRAQAVQAAAAGLDPKVEMNPILIKPEANSRAQVILMGRPWNTLDANDYFPCKDELWEHVTASLDKLRSEFELVIIEGAGSPAELNLKSGDIVNMRVAQYANAPTLLVGDIDRGGIFAQLLGTYWLLSSEEQNLLKGFVVNKFRGDIRLFEDGIKILEERGGIPVLGVVPYLHNLFIPEEDAVALENLKPVLRTEDAYVDIAIINLPRISNFDDFDPLTIEAGVRIRYIHSIDQLGKPDAIILPGTKSTVNDLKWLRERDLDRAILEHANAGGSVIGICGGYQMLGQMIRDPYSVESSKETVQGLGLLPIKTTFLQKKSTYRVKARVSASTGWMAVLCGQNIEGYEIHMGYTIGEPHWLEIFERNGAVAVQPDGAQSMDGNIWGCYIHGLFSNKNLRQAWLKNLGWLETSKSISQCDPFKASLTYLTDTLETSLDMNLLERMIWES
jgi:adenosylcobyric acid synthase